MTLPRLCFGYWFTGSIPEKRPVYGPTGGVAPGVGVCLDLMQRDGRWRPMLHAARYSYDHTAALVRERPAYFVPLDEPWPTTFRAVLGDAIERSVVFRRYGDHLARLVPRGHRALEVKLERRHW